MMAEAVIRCLSLRLGASASTYEPGGSVDKKAVA